ncbi:HAD-IA family hydrolase [Pseudomonas chlororaphis]|uniref:HAD family hydrolase n=1 Tax=Pseudomonas chlororaphis TaxID=587753 RepID=UPI001E3923E9|nr:HAD-IA family hydrolase [Pseudomonas chlororaphis]MCB2250665.1 HAD-IA family hydrolase [Pseudomonas chlororaphis]
MTIKLITFDLDDTLWDTAPVIVSAEAVLRQWLTDHAPRLGGVPVEHLWAIRERVLNAEPGLRYRISALRRRVLFHALGEAGYDQEQANALADQSFEVFLHARHQLEIFPEVQPTLEALANHFALGVVTNGNADVRRLGLADYFKFALCAEDIGIAKPDSRLFHEALQRGQATPETAVHIGDHPGDDIAGAQQAGLRAIWFNPAGKTWEAERRPDAEIRSLTELPKLLARWHSGA